MDDASPARQFKALKSGLRRSRLRGAARGFTSKRETILGKPGGTFRIKGKLLQDG